MKINEEFYINKTVVIFEITKHKVSSYTYISYLLTSNLIDIKVLNDLLKAVCNCISSASYSA